MTQFRLGWVVVLHVAAGASLAQPFVNWETPTVHPVEMTPDSARLLVTNLPDNRLEVFDITSGSPVRIGAIPVGLDPVSVRARTADEAWVVNQISDSVSIVNLVTMNVVATIKPGDEPADVVFAGGRAFISVSQENLVRVYDPADLSAAPTTIAIQGEDPRALATDGTRVFAAVFESGNKTTILDPNKVSNAALNPYAGDPNPPPNSGALFSPPKRATNPAPPPVGLIVKKVGTSWMDDNSGDWSSAVTWDLHDQDVAIIDASSLAVTYATGLMNANMALAVGPGGQVTVVGTDAINHVRFEPNLKGRFLRVNLAAFDPVAPGTPTITDLNPHLNYLSSSIPVSDRQQSIGDPRAIAWNAAGTRGYIAGMGSSSVIVIDGLFARQTRIDVGEGPSGLALDELRSRLYVLNRFEGSIETIDTSLDVSLGFINFFDPTPDVIRAGRPHIYNTRARSGLGNASCGSCHIDARADQLAWDLGDPNGFVKGFNQVCDFGFGTCENWHPMKGPMTTQTLVGLPGTGALHWRADRETISAFNPAFQGLNGADSQLTQQEMAELGAYLDTLKPPPNPYRRFDNSLATSLFNGGNPESGADLFANALFDGGVTACITCHALPAGTNGTVTSAGLIQESQSMKIPQLRNMHEKTGFSKLSLINNRGFGFTHDGSVDSIISFLQSPVFHFPGGANGAARRRDLEAFMFSFGTDTHAAVGVQTTLVDLASAPGSQVALLDSMRSLADTGVVGLIVKGRQSGLQRGYKYAGSGSYQSDRPIEVLTDLALRAGAALGSELTWTVVPPGSQTRIGIDRDGDTFFDRDEIDRGSDPADPSSTPPPPPPCPGDANSSGDVNFADISSVLDNWGSSYAPGTGPGDANHNGAVTFLDITTVLEYWQAPCP